MRCSHGNELRTSTFLFRFPFHGVSKGKQADQRQDNVGEKRKSYGINKAFGEKNIKLNWLNDSLLLSALLDADISLFVSLCF